MAKEFTTPIFGDNERAFLRALTELSAKHRLIITDNGTVVCMGREDAPYTYDLDEFSKLIRA